MKTPIYTEKTICRDCYKCVRQCPVKAIRVNDGSAIIMHELCIFCGKCIEVCPVNAKKLRSDTARARQLIELNDKVIASIAPSFPAEFDASPGRLIAALKKLGFTGVSETAVGAEIVSRKTEELLKESDKAVISSACPTVRELIRKYRPSLTERMADMASPLQTHATLLKEKYGADVKIIFIGPCISKKLEADDHTSPVDLALTFIELQEWFEAEGIDPSEEAVSNEEFILSNTIAASEFAVEGGMLNTIKAGAGTVDTSLVSCSGTVNLMQTFKDIEGCEGRGLFLEYLACEGGCISGRGMTSKGGYLQKRLRVLDYYNKQARDGETRQVCSTDLPETPISPDPVAVQKWSEQQLREVLSSINKKKKEDELNCGGCGYSTCRDFAAALLDGKAEQAMCAANMRKLAEKKSNALMKALPLGVVIANKNERILECNRKFLSLFSEIDQDTAAVAETRVEGLPLSGFIPGAGIFDKLRSSDLSMTEDKLRINGRVFRTFAFRVGGDEILGAVFQDITSPAVRREEIIRKTEEVIEKSLSSVQQIASLLGENAAETQLILNSLIDSYSESEKREYQ